MYSYCQAGLTCNMNTDKCEDAPWPPVVPEAGVSEAPPGPALGQHCEPTEVCAGDSVCLFQTDAFDGTGMCSAIPQAGEPCGIGPINSNTCALGDYCDENRKCQVRPVAGQPCGNEQGNSACADGFLCDVLEATMATTCARP